MSALHIERPGALTTVQDLGRWGRQAWGVPVSGAMDTWSARLANRLVGNADGAPVLEITFTGPRLTIERDAWIAVTGASFDVELNGQRRRTPFAARLQRGTHVVFGHRLAGARAYLAIDGGVAVPMVLGSAATHTRSAMGGFHGRALKAGDIVPLGLALPGAPSALAGDPIPLPSGGPVTLGVLSGADDGAWSRGAFEALCGATFVVSPQSDRMGYRLVGAASWPPVPGSLLSHPTARCAIQLPPDGTPVLLMADRQTTGGYAQISVLQRADHPTAAQLSPGDRVAFAGVSREAAAALYGKLEARLSACVPEVMS